MKPIFYISCFLSLIIASCREPKIEDIVGLWRSKDGAQIIFKKGGEFETKSLPRSIVFGVYSDKKLIDVSGNWEIVNFEKRWIISFSIEKGDSLYDKIQGGFNCQLEIDYSYINFKSPFILYFWGKDYNYKYKFYKKI